MIDSTRKYIAINKIYSQSLFLSKQCEWIGTRTNPWIAITNNFCCFICVCSSLKPKSLLIACASSNSLVLCVPRLMHSSIATCVIAPKSIANVSFELAIIWCVCVRESKTKASKQSKKRQQSKTHRRRRSKNDKKRSKKPSLDRSLYTLYT